MFVLETTTAVLIAFLAIIAYNEVQNRLAKGRPRRKDLESPGSPLVSVTSHAKPPSNDIVVDLFSVSGKDAPADEEMERYKQLYFKLHNLEQYADILPECRQLLLTMLSSTLNNAFNAPDNGILRVRKFSRDNLNTFLKAKDVDVTNQWEEYLVRRKAGGSREMFADQAEAKWWLRQAAPVKYVDGAWLGHINKISTPFVYRHITKNAWQVMSEELGDGDLAKNHVHVYRKLMEDIDAGLPAADSQDFIHSRHKLTEARCWKAALAQLIISLFPHEFLPEVLGFNMAYESLPLHLLKTVKELRELKLNPYYFELHISIDNADTGHAAMAMSVVADYIGLVEKIEGEEAAHAAWKRVQAGYILAEGLPTTPESPALKTDTEESFPHNTIESALLQIFAAKSFVAHKIHCNSRVKIGRRSLVDWLEPNAFKDVRWQQEFLHDLSHCKPWVIIGNSDKSRLVRELSWEGKMFGSFTEKEVEVVREWIDTLGSPQSKPNPDTAAYFEFTNRPTTYMSGTALEDSDVLVHYPVLSGEFQTTTISETIGLDVRDASAFDFDMTRLSLADFLPLWFTSTTLLEALPSVPVRAADAFGSAVVRILRAQTGFDVEGLGVAGMDEVRRTDDGKAIGLVELGLQMCHRGGLKEPTNLKEALALGSADSSRFSKWMVWMGMQWLTQCDVLVGMTWAFMEVHHAVAELGGDDALLGSKSRLVLMDVSSRERKGLRFCRHEIEMDAKRTAEFRRGVAVAREAIVACLSA
ncbi:MAG: hypothetical protein Q9183_001062 [Haloplaca sp. 2 TL-2023]